MSGWDQIQDMVAAVKPPGALYRLSIDNEGQNGMRIMCRHIHNMDMSHIDTGCMWLNDRIRGTLDNTLEFNSDQGQFIIPVERVMTRLRESVRISVADDLSSGRYGTLKSARLHKAICKWYFNYLTRKDKIAPQLDEVFLEIFKYTRTSNPDLKTIRQTLIMIHRTFKTDGR